jgi:predicted porin
MRCAFLGVALALAAANAPAQALDTITLYGRVHAMVEWVESRGEGVLQPRRARVSDEASRFGVRGTEALGPDITVWFQLETNFAFDPTPRPGDPPVRFADRNSGVGVNASWGTLTVGRWDSAFTVSQVFAVDPFNDLGLAAMSDAAAHQNNFSRRLQNVFQYSSPRVLGWRTRVDFQAREAVPNPDNGARPYTYGWMIAYVTPASYISIAFERHKDQLGTVGSPGIHEDGRGIAGYHQFGPVRASAQYGMYRRTGAVTQRSYLLGLHSVHGQHELLGSYQNSRNGGPGSAPAQPRCNVVGLGYRYRFSLRFSVLAQYAHVNNKVGALCVFAINPLAIAANQDLRGIGVGMRMEF